ncbi:MAG: thiolase family protein, partial [Rhodothermales bacterium]
MPEAFIVSSIRTAVGKADRGALRHFRPEEMGAAVVKEAVRRVKGLEPEAVDDVLIGCAFPEGPQGQNMGRTIAQMAGLPDEIPGATINRFCSSGLQTIAMATQAIRTGFADIVVAGGAESMSQVPMTGFFFQPNPRMVAEDVDVYVSMGITAENVAAKFNVSREEQDRFAQRSHERALDAIRSGRFEEEIVPLEVEEVLFENGSAVRKEREFRVDEGPRADSTLDALGKLKPVFRLGGTVTAGNSSQRSDGAAATVVMSEERMSELGVEPMGRLVGFALQGVASELMGIGPIGAIHKVLRQTGLSLSDIGLVELNEAF